jgi:hypothetical protein
MLQDALWGDESAELKGRDDIPGGVKAIFKLV